MTKRAGAGTFLPGPTTVSFGEAYPLILTENPADSSSSRKYSTVSLHPSAMLPL
jgi:hypothetical protein